MKKLEEQPNNADESKPLVLGDIRAFSVYLGATVCLNADTLPDVVPIGDD